jgi:hypothetical protein
LGFLPGKKHAALFVGVRAGGIHPAKDEVAPAVSIDIVHGKPPMALYLRRYQRF